MAVTANRTSNHNKKPWTSLFPSDGAIEHPGMIKFEATFVQETVKKARIELWQRNDDDDDQKGAVKRQQKQGKQKLNLKLENEMTNQFSVVSSKPLDVGTHCMILQVEFKTGPIKKYKTGPICFRVQALTDETTPEPTEALSTLTEAPSPQPTWTMPSPIPAVHVSATPSEPPSASPFHTSMEPTESPSAAPSFLRSTMPSPRPSATPTSTSTFAAVAITTDPSTSPSSAAPTTRTPTTHPSAAPTRTPTTRTPTTHPSANPSIRTHLPWTFAQPLEIGLNGKDAIIPDPSEQSPNADLFVNQAKLQLEVKWEVDAYPSEFTYQITDDRGNVMLSKERAKDKQGSGMIDIDSGRTYCFRGMDDFGDGICCKEGNGRYEVSVDGTKFLDGGAFRYSTGYHCFVVDSEGKATRVEPPATDLCERYDPNKFNMCVEIVDVTDGALDNNGLNDAFSKAFQIAQQTWAGVMGADDGTDHSVLGYFVDDLYVEAAAAAIDGSGTGDVNILGFAGTGLTWKDAQGYTKAYSGYMSFDIADMAKMVKDKTLSSVVTHEMAHVLGLGTLWYENGLYTQGGKYTGQHANEAYRRILLESGADIDVSEATVPIEEDGPKGTVHAHWDEDCLQHEIMTGRINAVNAFSNITLGALRDLGYIVNYDRAETYKIGDIGKCVHTRRLRGSGTGTRQSPVRQLHGQRGGDGEPNPRQVELVTQAGQKFLKMNKGIKQQGSLYGGGVDIVGPRVVDVLFADKNNNIFALFVGNED